MGIFIQIDIDQQEITPETAARIVALCPVDIFALDNERLAIRPEQEDECTLCQLCLDITPAGALTIRKNYKDEALVSHGKGL